MCNEESDLSRFPSMPPVIEMENNDVHANDELSQQNHGELGRIQHEKLNTQQKTITEKCGRDAGRVYHPR